MMYPTKYWQVADLAHILPMHLVQFIRQVLALTRPYGFDLSQALYAGFWRVSNPSVAGQRQARD
jgi:hypothetical protein